MFKQSLLIVAIALCSISMNVHAINTSKCIALEEVYGKSCGSPDSMQIKATNKCSQQVYIKICLEKINGKWSCGTDSGLNPGQTNTGFYACYATGKYEWSTCTGGSAECGFKK